MIKEALQYIISLQKEPFFKEIDGNTYTDTNLNRVSYIPKAEPLTMTTLTSLVEYIKSNIDVMAPEMIVHVESPTRVTLCSQLNIERDRENLVHVKACIPEFRFNSYYDNEEFNIALQSKFLDVYDRNLLLKFCGNVEDENVVAYGDDGISQKATVRSGIASRSEVVVPNPVVLAPYRTFLEVEQPASEFIFRVRKDRNGIECAVFEADGGKWKMDAMERIRAYLAEELKDLPKFKVIA